MSSIKKLQEEIDKIKIRNKQVEAEKAWETSRIRKLLIFVLTYLVIVIFFFVASFPDPFANAVVPSVAFILSTLTVPFLKQRWLKNIYRK